MKTLIQSLMALVLAVQAGASPFVVSRTFMEAIMWVESRNGAVTVNPGNPAVHGPYQISEAYLKDANDYAGTRFTVEDLDSVEVSSKVMLSFWNRYVRKFGLVPTYEILARMHNGGPRGYLRQDTVAYWHAVKRRMEELESSGQHLCQPSHP